MLSTNFGSTGRLHYISAIHKVRAHASYMDVTAHQSRMIIYGTSIAILIFLVLIGNIVWYLLKAKLKENGYQTRWFYGHFSDISNAIELARKTTNKSERKSLRSSVAIIIFVLLALPVFAFLLIDNSDYRECDIYNKVLALEMEATVIAKHDYKGLDYTGDLELTPENQSINEYELVLVFKNIYEQVKVGDKLIKKAGEDILYIVGELRTLKIQTRKREFCD